MSNSHKHTAPTVMAVVIAASLVATTTQAEQGDRQGTAEDAQETPADKRHADVEPEEIFVEANAAYEGGEYERAAELYQKIIDRGVSSGWVYFNLGNSHLRGGYLGKAIAAYLKSQSFLPREGDVRANLAFARKSTKDAISAPQSEEILRTLFFWHFGLSKQELLWLLAATNGLFWLVLGIRLFRRDAENLRWSAGLLLVVVVAVGISTAIRTFVPNRVAVMSVHEVNVHSGTHHDTVVRFRLHAGTETRVVDEDEQWVRIALPDGKQGWVSKKNVALVTL